MHHKDFNNKNLLAIDHGSKVIGLAQFTPGKDPFPYAYGRIIVENLDQIFKEIKKVVMDEAVDIIIIGLPHLTDGTATAMTESIRQFAEKLKQALQTVPIYLQDETLSSYEAQQRMKNSPQYNFRVDPKQLDAVAATIILEDFLTSQTFCLL